MLTWQWSTLSALTAVQVHAMLALRQTVFIIEQQCIFADIDNIDQSAMHLLGWQQCPEQPVQQGCNTEASMLVAYLRVLSPHVVEAYEEGLEKMRETALECVLGRVVTAPAVRGTGIGRRLMDEGLRRTARQFPEAPIKISAQQRLQRFYEGFGFVRVSAPYDEDGITHIEMLRIVL